MNDIGEFGTDSPLCNDGAVSDRTGEVLDDFSEPGEECGVFAVWAPGKPVAHLVYLGIFALQHRGQESAGIATSDGHHLTVVKDMGLVTTVFDDRTLAGLDGRSGIGHTRYSTTGSSVWHNAQPVYRDVGTLQLALAHNGNLTNTAALAEELGMLAGTVSSDTDVLAELIAAELRLPHGTDTRPAAPDRPDEHNGERASGLVDSLSAVLPRLAARSHWW